MKAFFKHSELTQLLAALEKQGAFINAGMDIGERFILTDWQNNQGDIMFACKPIGRDGDEIIYEVNWTPEFEKAMSANLLKGLN